MVSKMVPIACTVCMNELHYPLSKSCMCGTARNFDSIMTIICICLDVGPKTIEFQFGSFWICSVCGISNTSLDGSIYWQVFYPIVTKISTIVNHGLKSFNFENGAHRTKKVQFRKWCGSNAELRYP